MRQKLTANVFPTVRRFYGKMLHIDISLESPVRKKAKKKSAAIVYRESMKLASLLLYKIRHMLGTLI